MKIEVSPTCVPGRLIETVALSRSLREDGLPDIKLTLATPAQTAGWGAEERDQGWRATPPIEQARLLSAGDRSAAAFAKVTLPAALEDQWIGLTASAQMGTLRDGAQQEFEQIQAAVEKLLPR